MERFLKKAIFSVWENPDKSCVASHVVSVFGDLRDYEDVDEIEKWFARICEKEKPRSAILEVDVEYQNKYIFHYDYNKPLNRIEVPNE